MTNDELNQIEARCNARIELPCNCITGLSICGQCHDLYVPNSFTFKASAEFGKHARNDIRNLISELRKSRLAVVELEGKLKNSASRSVK